MLLTTRLTQELEATRSRRCGRSCIRGCQPRGSWRESAGHTWRFFFFTLECFPCLQYCVCKILKYITSSCDECNVIFRIFFSHCQVRARGLQGRVMYVNIYIYILINIYIYIYINYVHDRWEREGCWRLPPPQVVSLLALLVQKYKYWRSCLTPAAAAEQALEGFHLQQVLSLLALLVQKYKYWHQNMCEYIASTRSHPEGHPLFFGWLISRLGQHTSAHVSIRQHTRSHP
jgi:hypothetical protein